MRFLIAGMSIVASRAITSLAVEGGEHLVVERRRGVDHDVVEVVAEDVQDAADQLGGDQGGRPRLDRRDEGREPGGVRGQQRQDPLGVQGLTERDRVGDRVRREQLERDRDVAEGEVEVDEADLALAAVREHRRQVRRDRGLAAAALRGEHRDDAPPGSCGSALSAVSTLSRMARASARVRRTAALRPAMSRSSTTSRTPARSASPSNDVSMRRRTRTKPRLGRVTRIDLGEGQRGPLVDRGTHHDAVLADVERRGDGEARRRS